MANANLPGFGDEATWGGRLPYDENEDAMSALDAQCLQAARDDSDSQTFMDALINGEVVLGDDFDRIIGKMIIGEPLDIFHTSAFISLFENAVHEMLCKKAKELANAEILKRARDYEPFDHCF